jgi:23S rRNA (guanosine2251-2'-O)-methyltransferase
VASSRERNDRRPPPRGAESGPQKPFHRRGRGRGAGAADTGGAEWLWGRHAVEAALANPRRTGLRRLVATSRGAESLHARLTPAHELRVEIMEPGEIGRLLPQGAVHQGVALLSDPLEPLDLAELADPADGVLLLLDQVTDPQNVGAIFRSAAAFGARGVVLQDRHAPPLSGALAKASAGAVDITPHARVVNLSRALEQLADLGWRAVGLAGDAEGALEEALDPQPTVLVLGSEGEGLRRLVSEHCEVLARIPMPGGFESLNVSSAAAVALYAASRKVKGRA